MKTQILKLATILLILTGGFSSCKEKDKSFLTVDETSIAIAGEAGSHSIMVNSNNDWTAVVENAESTDWCTLDNSTGNGNGTITINIAKNLLPIARSATVKITSGNSTKSVIINQEASEEPEYPIDTPFTEYLLGETLCEWKDFQYNGNCENNTLVIINSIEELEQHICIKDIMGDCTAPCNNYHSIDFSRHTLLLAYGIECYRNRPYYTSLQQLSSRSYVMEVKLRLSGAASFLFWQVPIIVSKIADDSVVELTITRTND